MRWFVGLIVAIAGLVAPAGYGQEMDEIVSHHVVIQEDDRFCGWPANGGMWSWGDEMLVGFTYAYYLENPTGGHDIDRDRPSEFRLGRSVDGGETWTIEDFVTEAPDGDAPTEPFDFRAPDSAVKLRNNDWWVTQDRGKSWVGPYTLPSYGRPGLLARTDYIVEGPQRLTAFLAAQKTEGSEGQALCIRTTDGGMTWQQVGWIGPEPAPSYGYAIMPATVALNWKTYLSFIRRGAFIDEEKQWWIEPYLSPDGGTSWYPLESPIINNAGNPATLTTLDNGWLALAYGWRSAPYGIRARVSKDDGVTWSDEIILRADGGSWDIGYPRTALRSDGKCVTVYYYHEPGQDIRYIGSTVWDPVAALRTLD